MKRDALVQDSEAPPPNWRAIISIALGVAGLIIAEFLPAGMLTPMARDLRITEGMAGQAVTATSVFAVVTSLVLAYLTRNADRRHVLISLSALLLCSNLTVAFAGTFPVLLGGRVLLGIALGGFWSMASATAARLVPQGHLARAIAIIFGASSFASVLAAPLGSYLGGLIGWRAVFILSAGFSAIALVSQALTIPALRPIGSVKLDTLLTVMAKPRFSAGMAAVALVFCGHFATFTYLRPFLEQTTAAGTHGISAILLVFGIANFIGTSFARMMIEKNLRRALMVLPLGLGLLGVGFLVSGTSISVIVVLVALWGAIFGPVPVVWSAWVTRKVPEHAETAGGLFIAAIQLSAAVGALAGGVLFDSSGSAGVFSLSTASWLLSGVVVAAFVGVRHTDHSHDAHCDPGGRGRQVR